jgi:hypothetical protein
MLGNFFSISANGKLNILRLSSVELDAECNEEFDAFASSSFLTRD